MLQASLSLFRSTREAAGTGPRSQTPGLWLQYVFLCRAPLAFGLGLAVLPPLAVYGAPMVFANLFDLPVWRILVVAWLTSAAAGVVMITLRLLVREIPQRFGLPPLAVPRFADRWRLLLALVPALPTLGLLLQYGEGPLALRILAVAGGLAITFLGLLLAAVGQVLAAPSGVPGPDLVLATGWGPLGRIPRLDLMRRMPRPRGLFEGYLDPVWHRLANGHLMAGVLLLLSALAYAALYPLTSPSGWQAPFVGAHPSLPFPALGHVLLVVLMAAWFFPGVTFFFDRWRIPVLTLTVGWILLTGILFDTDHHYRVLPARDVVLRPLDEAAAAAPAGDLEAPGGIETILAADRPAGEPVGGASAGSPGEDPRPEDAPSGEASEAFAEADAARGELAPVVVVAASGGGITASQWTALVLTRLQEELGEELPDAIRLISTVSGGSVGALFYLDRFDDGEKPDREDLEAIVEQAGASSLEAVSWGLAYPDLWRTVAPILVRDPLEDRGWALEEVWRDRLEHPEATLLGWRRQVDEGHLPTVVFNTTVVETGEQLRFTPIEWGPEPGPREHPQDFLRRYPGKDIPMVTAARLSATFPWVTPVSRPWLEHGDEEERVVPGYHLADGGYYDNFGLVSVVDWMLSLDEDQLDELRARRVLLIRIVAFPPDDLPDHPPERGWLYTVAGPLITMLNVRSASQRTRNEFDKDLLRELFAHQGIEVVDAPFILEVESPLSWKLTEAERAAILASWSPETCAARTVRVAFRRADARTLCSCPDPPEACDGAPAGTVR